jgi:hypothetical protein
MFTIHHFINCPTGSLMWRVNCGRILIVCMWCTIIFSPHDCEDMYNGMLHLFFSRLWILCDLPRSHPYIWPNVYKHGIDPSLAHGPWNLFTICVLIHIHMHFPMINMFCRLFSFHTLSQWFIAMDNRLKWFNTF